MNMVISVYAVLIVELRALTVELSVDRVALMMNEHGNKRICCTDSGT